MAATSCSSICGVHLEAVVRCFLQLTFALLAYFWLSSLTFSLLSQILLAHSLLGWLVLCFDQYSLRTKCFIVSKDFVVEIPSVCMNRFNR